MALSYFQKTAELQHLTRAAAALHIAQPSLSRTIGTMEEELGVELFERRGRNIILNQYGEILLRRTNRIMQELETARQELADVQQATELTVTLSLYAASKLLPSLLMSFKDKHPEICFQILQQDAQAPPHINPPVDLSLFSSVNPVENSHSITLLEEDILLAMPTSNPHAPLPEVALSTFSGEGFICLQAGKSLRTIADFYCQMAGFSPHIILESDSPETVREFIRTGIGISFVPQITWCDVCGENITLVPISSPCCHRYIGLSWNDTDYLSPAVVLLRDFLIEYFADFAKKRAQSHQAID